MTAEDRINARHGWTPDTSPVSKSLARRREVLAANGGVAPSRASPQSVPGNLATPVGISRIDSTALTEGPPGKPWRFNAGMIRYQGRLLLAYRTGWGAAGPRFSEVHVCELSEGYTPGPSTKLQLSVPSRSDLGAEDPRLFVYRNRLHVAFVGVAKGVVVNVMYARLTDDLKVEEVFYPHYPGRAAWEKNWGFFQHGDDLFAVYSISPHVVLRIDGNRAEKVAEVSWSPKWSGGHLRGGAPPVQVGNELWHWFHGCVGDDRRRVYNYGLYTFTASPPFEPVAYTPAPLVVGDWRNRDGNEIPVVFPCGAILDRTGVWRVSLGVNDRRIEIHAWDHETVKATLRVRSGGAA